MPTKTKRAFVNYQERAQGFSVGDLVAPFGLAESWSGVVSRVFPAIGMVDVEYPDGVKRLPVEDLQNFTNLRANPKPPYNGDADLYPVRTRLASAEKRALYWTAPDRKHQATKGELDTNRFTCPKCKNEEGGSVTLVSRNLYRVEGKDFKILVCPSCTFAIQRSDIVNCGG